ncbi:Pre-mRNA-processing factor 6 [Euphorbia peplus]|nr:Pre-mRNA-processing factor 6 [Euphorbia peplus]
MARLNSDYPPPEIGRFGGDDVMDLDINTVPEKQEEQRRDRCLNFKLDTLSDSVSAFEISDEPPESAGCVLTCQPIVQNTIGIGDENRKRTWLSDADDCKNRGSIETARAILHQACVSIPNSEEFWLAAFQLEYDNHQPERARLLLAQAREQVGTERVWIKSATLERELGNTEEARRLLDQGYKRFPSFELWLLLGKLEERLGHSGKAKEVYESTLNNSSSCTELWLSLAYLEEKMTGPSKARAVFAMARKVIPRNHRLWFASVHAAARHGNKKEANILRKKALQECPIFGTTWAVSGETLLAPVKKCPVEKCACVTHVIAAVAKLLCRIRKVDEARTLLNRAVTLAPDNGDFWALYYKFEIQHGTVDNQKDVLKWCIAAQPKHGERWEKIANAGENANMENEAILTNVVAALVKEEKARKRIK